jgi:hypothetical protein
MLLQVAPSSLVQRCDFCGEQRTVGFDEIVAGLEAGDPPEPLDPNIVTLPACAECGAKEFLNRVASSEPSAGVDAFEHRRAVNAVHAALVAGGRTAPTLTEYFATEAIDTEVVPLPWSLSFSPRPIVGAMDPATAAFLAYLAARQGGA